MAQYTAVETELDRFNSTYHNHLNIIGIEKLKTQVASLNETFTPNYIECDALTTTNINSVDFTKGVIDNMSQYETDLLDLSQNIYSNPTLVSLNASDKINENNIPINYTQSFKLASGMNIDIGYWGRFKNLSQNGNSFTINKFRSNISCFEAYVYYDPVTFNETRWRLTSNTYAGIWRVDFRMVLSHENTAQAQANDSYYVNLICNGKTNTSSFQRTYNTLSSNKVLLTSYAIFDVDNQDNYFYFTTRLWDSVATRKNELFSVTDFDITFTYLGK
jgi:hypothetical protein